MTASPSGRDAPTRLRVEGREDPLGLPPGRVRFAWLAPGAVQTASQIVVATDPDALPAPGAADAPDPAVVDGVVWDSGAVDGDATSDVPYVGPDLGPTARYHWTVRASDGAGAWSDWAAPSTFETGVREWSGEWLAPAGPAYEESPAPAPAFRRAFAVEDLDAVERARLHVAVGGTGDPRVNGERVTDAAMDPQFTDYEERVLAATYDVTPHLREGENALAVVCGRERYALTAENAWAWDVTPWQRPHPELLAELHLTYADGRQETLATDAETWRVAPTETTFDCLYGGEEVDASERAAWSDPAVEATRDVDRSWAVPTAVEGPPGEVEHQVLQPIRPVAEHDPVTVDALDDGSYVFDFGTVLAGWVRLAVDVPAGTELTIEHGEKRDEDGSVPTEQSPLSVPFQTDTYVCAGVGEDGDARETWEPRFTYKGFRYVQVSGLPDAPDGGTLTAVEAHNDIASGCASEWSASDDLLDQIHENTRRALRSNHHGMPTDTPAYEKHGWTGDAQLTAETALLNFRMVPLYRKYVRDIADAQLPSGELPPFVPTSDWGYSAHEHDEPFTAPIPAWDAAYVLMPWWVYEYAGDERLIAEHYEGMCDLLAYLDGYREDGVLDEGLGDWFPPGHGEITWRPPEGPAITSTAYFCRMARVLADAAGVLGRDRDRRTYARLAERARESFVDAFYDADRGVFATGEVEGYRQTSNLFPLAYDLVPRGERDRVLENLVADVRDTHDGHLNTGILGTKHLLPVLTDAGHVDLAYRVATQRDYPSWGDWIERGVT
ncbi:MAG: family 78 glycoside hydrolase catalytic domain, partial [Halobacteriaceae archaeon]